jgi:flavin reductase (DIM6/NTAB) family NADH-FMN oxidoreductase RutF
MAMALEAKAVRALSRDVPTCVAVVAVKEGQDTHHHMTVGSLCVVSQIPPLLSFCVVRGTAAHSRMCEAPRYCISVLAQDQELVAKRFAAPRDGRTSVEPGTFHGFFAAPHSLAWLLCTRDRLIDAGDHTIVLAEVAEARRFDRRPLLYWRRGYRRLTIVSPRAIDGLATKRDHEPNRDAIAETTHVGWA